MTEIGHDIQTISTKWTDFKTDIVLPFGQVTEKKRKTPPFPFFKISFCQRTNENKMLNEKN
jgi:hypothetical protein